MLEPGLLVEVSWVHDTCADRSALCSVDPAILLPYCVLWSSSNRIIDLRPVDHAPASKAPDFRGIHAASRIYHGELPAQ